MSRCCSRRCSADRYRHSSSTAHEIAAFTERDPAEEEALLCKALSAHLANRADLFRDRSEEVNGLSRDGDPPE